MRCTDERLLIDSSQITICSGCHLIPEQDQITGGFSLIGLAVVKKGLRLVRERGEQRHSYPILLEKKVPFQVVLISFSRSSEPSSPAGLATM